MNEPTTMRRWVTERADQVAYTDSGLTDLTRMKADWYVGERPLDAGELSTAAFSYVLLAPGGFGKTTLLESLMGTDRDAKLVDLRSAHHGGIAGLIGEAASDGRAVYIDALDEVLASEPRASFQLSRLLTAPSARLTRWRLMCRPAAWDRELAEHLVESLPDFRQLTLLPLDPDALRDLVTQAGAPDLITAADGRGLERLLASPMQAIALSAQWRDEQNLPKTVTESMDFSVRRLLTSRTPFSAAPKLPFDQLRTTAQRVAAITIFCSNGRLTTAAGQAATPEPRVGGSAADAALAVSDLPSHPEPDTAEAFTTTRYREVLRSSLFVAPTPHELSFAHHSYAEFLSAEYLKRRGVTGPRLATLLGADLNGVVPGALLGVFGWCLALTPDLDPGLVERNALALLTTAAIEVNDDRVRAQMAHGLLAGAAAGWHTTGWGVKVTALSHPGLGMQITEAVLGGLKNRWHAIWASKLAEDCRATGAANAVLSIAVDDRWPGWVRAEAVRAMMVVPDATPPMFDALLPLLDADESADPDDELLGTVARALLPDKAPIAAVVSRLRAARNPNFIGAYSQFLRDLPDLLTPPDVGELLDAAAGLDYDRRDRRGHPDRTFANLLPRLIARAWDLDDGTLTAKIARLLIAVGSPDRGSLRRCEDMLPWLRPNVDNERRRRLLLEVNRLDPVRGRWTMSRFGLLIPEDGIWILDTIENLPEEQQHAAAKVAHLTLSNPADAATADRVLGLPKSHPAYKELGALRGTCSMESELARDYRQLASENRNFAAQTTEEWRERFTRLLEASSADVMQWWLTARAIGNPLDSNDLDVLTNPDFRSRPAWVELNETQQANFLRQGTAYVREHQPAVETARGAFSWESFRDWNGVYLLYTLAQMQRDASASRVEPQPSQGLLALAETTWTKWASAVVHIPRFGTTPDWPLAVYEVAPEAARSKMRKLVIAQVANATRPEDLTHPMDAEAGPEYAAALRALVRNDELTEELRENALARLEDVAPNEALVVAAEQTGLHAPFLPAWRTVARLSPNDFVRSWLQGRVHPGDREFGALDTTKIQPSLLPAVAASILDTCSFDSDTSLAPDESIRSDSARRLRHGLLDQMAEAGLRGPLEHLAHGRPEADQTAIRHFLTRSRSRESELSHRALRPTAFMALLNSAGARLIRDDASLKAVILEQLDSIAAEVPLGAFRDVWNGHPGAEGASMKDEDDISDYLLRQLNQRLRPNVVLDREIQVSRNKAAGTGQRMDIVATVTGGIAVARVIIEAKRIYHRDLMTALEKQLVAQYLEPLGLSQGIYLIYWVRVGQRGRGRRTYGGKDPVQLVTTLAKQASAHAPQVEVTPYLLDFSAPT